VQKPEEFRNPTRPEFSGFSWAWHEKPELLLSEILLNACALKIDRPLELIKSVHSSQNTTIYFPTIKEKEPKFIKYSIGKYFIIYQIIWFA
jgi:hypothetical protein